LKGRFVESSRLHFYRPCSGPGVNDEVDEHDLIGAQAFCPVRNVPRPHFGLPIETDQRIRTNKTEDVRSLFARSRSRGRRGRRVARAWRRGVRCRVALRFRRCVSGAICLYARGRDLRGGGPMRAGKRCLGGRNFSCKFSGFWAKTGSAMGVSAHRARLRSRCRLESALLFVR